MQPRATTLAIVLSVLMAGGVGFMHSSEMEEMEVFEWAREAEVYVQARFEHQLLPMSRVGQEEVEWRLVATADDGGGITAIAMLARRVDGSVFGALVEFPDENLAQQLYRLRQSDPTLAAGHAFARLLAHSGECSETDAEGLRTLADMLGDVTIAFLPREDSAPTGRMYKVRVTNDSGERHEFMIPQGDAPAARWCARLLIALKSCLYNARIVLQVQPVSRHGLERTARGVNLMPF
jgi:hypothetical protein